MSMKEKLAVTVLVTTLALFGLVVVLYRMIKDKNADYTQIVLNQHSSYDSRTIPYRRGDIVDRNGTYLATSEKVYNLILDPNQINQDKDNYLEPTVSALCEVFGYDRADLMTVISANENSYYVPYEKQISADKKEEFEAKNTPESRFAHTMDNLQPVILNAATNGKAWKEHGVYLSQFMGRQEDTPKGSEVLWQYEWEKLVEPFLKNGTIKDDFLRE